MAHTDYDTEWSTPSSGTSIKSIVITTSNYHVTDVINLFNSFTNIQKILSIMYMMKSTESYGDRVELAGYSYYNNYNDNSSFNLYTTNYVIVFQKRTMYNGTNTWLQLSYDRENNTYTDNLLSSTDEIVINYYE